jgi:hypothetical protein
VPICQIVDKSAAICYYGLNEAKALDRAPFCVYGVEHVMSDLFTATRQEMPTRPRRPGLFAHLPG